MLLSIALLLATSFAVGALPLTGWAVRVFTRRDLRVLGTGNVGVSAAFIHGGKIAGIAAVLAEIARGILPVLGARIWFPDTPAIALALLIPLVAGRSAIARGGGVTNAVWGIFAFSPPVAVTSGISGLLVWGLAEVVWGKGDRTRLFATRCGCLCTPIWVWVWRQNAAEFLAATGLAFLLFIISLLQGDDMALSRSQKLLSLDDSLDAKVCGDKAAKLSQLKRANFNVPSGWIVLHSEGIGNRESEIGNRELGIGNWESGIGNLENSQNLSIPNTLIQNLKSKIQNRMIVRSSAVGEDGDISSAAGQYQTIGPVFSEAELIDAIHRCRQSYWTSEAVAYRRQRQLPDTQMAVLIQPYIDSKFAGVMFTRNPLDGGSQIIIEALPGGAESVVGGQFTPVHLEVDFSTSELLEKSLIEIGKSETWLLRKDALPSADSVKNPVMKVGVRKSCEIETNSIINKSIVAELVKLAQAIEAFFHGIPQDIEWSWDGDQLWILQSRPITNLQPFWDANYCSRSDSWCN